MQDVTLLWQRSRFQKNEFIRDPRSNSFGIGRCVGYLYLEIYRPRRYGSKNYAMLSQQRPGRYRGLFPGVRFGRRLGHQRDLADAISEDVENLSYHIVYFSLSDTTSPSDKEIKKIKKQLKGFPSFDEDLLEEITYVTVKCKLDHYYGFNSSNTHFLLIKYDGSWYWWPFETK